MSFLATMYFFQHLCEENGIDFDIMCREPVMKETWWEHHVVSVEPELSSILGIELILISSVVKSAPGKDASRGEDIDKKTGVVKGSICVSRESGTNGSHSTKDLVNRHPQIVHHSEGSMEGVGSILSLAHLNTLEDSSDKSWSCCKLIINKMFYWS